jgi:hypothetical protein
MVVLGPKLKVRHWNVTARVKEIKGKWNKNLKN